LAGAARGNPDYDHLVASKVAAEMIEIDMRAAMPSDPSLQTGGRVIRHFCRGGAVYDARRARALADAAAQAGMRDPACLEHTWESLWEAMAPIGALLLEARAADVRLQNLHEAFGDSPTRPVPPDDVVDALRVRVGRLLGLDAADCAARHPASPWRFRLVGRVQDLCNDPDRHLREWLEHGAPMGIRKDIEVGHLFPETAATAALEPEAVFDHVKLGNHPSFRHGAADGGASGADVIAEHLNAGFGWLFRDLAAAEKHMQTRITPAPLGCIVKHKEDGSRKVRVIMDLRRNRVNDATRVPERQVLPTIHHHALDLLRLTRGLGVDEQIHTMVLDFENAFMGIPLARVEQCFNACYLEVPVVRTRAAAFPDEVGSGQLIVWQVLGFGGKPNPLVYSRAASFAARTGQALLRPSAASRRGVRHGAPGRLQLYVDDPVLSLSGSPAGAAVSIDLVLLWWLSIGPPLAWRKGSLGTASHRWIGGIFDVRPISAASDAERAQVGNASHFVVVSVPPDFVATLSEDLRLFTEGGGHIAEEDVQRTLGRCGRLAYLIPAARPFVAGLWGTLSAADASARHGRREAPPGRLPIVRFRTAARWIYRLLNPPPRVEPWLPLEHLVTEHLTEITLARSPRAEVDASPWGGGAALYVDGRLTEFWALRWSAADAAALETEIGDPAGQTSWELLALFLTLVLWGRSCRGPGLALLGDNLGSLEAALNLRGRGVLPKISREIAWRRARDGWRYAAGHLPSERNGVADSLSRLDAPAAEAKGLPAEVAGATRRDPPDVESLWTL